MVGNSLSVILSYFPPDVRVPESVWDAFLPYLSGNTVWLGDFNTQHTAWGSGISNPRDDLVFLIRGRDIVRMKITLNTALNRVSQWMSDRSLHIAPEKSSAMILAKSRLPVFPEPLALNSVNIPWKTTTKYLGVMLDSKLKWRPQIDSACVRATNALNCIKSISGIYWGSHSSSLLLLYKTLVRPHLDYASLIYGRCAKATLAKFDRVQYAALRVVLGMMRSTPINILLSESAEMPLYIRRRWLAYKYISKIFRLKDHTLLMMMRGAENLNVLWFNGTIPPYIEAYLEVIKKHATIWQAKLLPYFELQNHIRTNIIPIFTSGLPKGAIDNNAKFLEYINNKFSDHVCLFTDASVSTRHPSVGYGIYSSTLSINMKGRLPNHWSIFLAEIYAISVAVDLVISKKIPKTLIVTDSLSALEYIKSGKFDSNVDINTVDMLEKFWEAKNLDLRIACLWVPSHSSIHGNDMADRLANEGRLISTPQTLVAGPNELWPAYRRQLKTLWCRDFGELGKLKGKIYAQMVNNRPYILKHWFHKIDRPRSYISTFCRLRSGHCSSPPHLYRLRVVDSPLCECGENFDFYHLFFDCDRLKLHSDLLYESLTQMNFKLPINIYEVLFSGEMGAYDALFAFLKACLIKL